MKKILAMVLALCLLAPCAFAEETVVYKSDKFFLLFPEGWASPPEDFAGIYTKITDGKYDMSKGFVYLEEISESNAKKGKTPIENSYLELYMYDFDRDGYEIIAKDSIYINGVEKNVALMEASIGEATQYIYLSFVSGNGSMLMILYGSSSYRTSKPGLQEILESIIVR